MAGLAAGRGGGASPGALRGGLGSAVTGSYREAWNDPSSWPQLEETTPAVLQLMRQGLQGADRCVAAVGMGTAVSALHRTVCTLAPKNGLPGKLDPWAKNASQVTPDRNTQAGFLEARKCRQVTPDRSTQAGFLEAKKCRQVTPDRSTQATFLEARKCRQVTPDRSTQTGFLETGSFRQGTP